MSYIMCEYTQATTNKYAIFEVNSYRWSDWHTTLDDAIKSIRTRHLTHMSDNLRNILSEEPHLRLFVIPKLLPLPELLDQYPEIFI